MGSTFYALPCKLDGESFLLRTRDGPTDRAILVDAAYNDGPVGSTVFENLCAEVPDLSRIDIVICTHEDSDHCAGLPNLLTLWTGASKSVGELWLPGRWAVAFPEALRPHWSEQKLIKGAISVAAEIEEIATLFDDDDWLFRPSLLWAMAERPDLLFEAQLGRVDVESELLEIRTDEQIDRYDRNWWGSNEEIDTAEAAANIKSWRESPASSASVEGKVREIIVDANQEGLQQPQSEKGFALAVLFAASALRAHDRILDIAAVALANRIPIRWFDYDTFVRRKRPQGGDPGFLEPVNSVEVVRTRSSVSPEGFFLSLRLSQSNVESLVFLKHGTELEPPVLFTADSRLAQGMNSPAVDFPNPIPHGANWSAPIITAPHHASKTNDHAYGVASRWFSGSDPIYVRNGGKHVKHGIASSYLRWPRRTCVRCSGLNKPQRMIRLEAHRGCWNLPVHPVICECT